MNCHLPRVYMLYVNALTHIFICMYGLLGEMNTEHEKSWSNEMQQNERGCSCAAGAILPASYFSLSTPTRGFDAIFPSRVLLDAHAQRVFSHQVERETSCFHLRQIDRFAIRSAHINYAIDSTTIAELSINR